MCNDSLYSGWVELSYSTPNARRRRRVIHLHRTFIDFHGHLLFSQYIRGVYDLHYGGCRY